MADTSRTEVFEIDINKFYDVLLDYKSYPEYLEGCDDIEVLEFSETGAMVKYSLNLIKTFNYVLKLEHSRPNKISWSFESGDIFKKNEGAWELKDLGDGKIQVNYFIDLGFKLMVPKMILKKLVNRNLPSMMQSIFERARDN